MGHPDSGQILAFLDGEVEGAEAEALRTHMVSCPECGTRLEGVEATSGKAARALSALDVEAPDLQKAMSRIQARQSTGVAGRSISLPKAASIALLLTAAAATALPGSPVRRWVVQGWHALTGSDPITSPVEDRTGTGGDQDALAPGTGLPETGASISASAQGVEIWIHDLPTEADLRVIWVDGDEAWIYAGEGTRFNRIGGRLEAFAPPGAVRVELPRNLRQVVVGLDGSVLLRKSGDDVEILAPTQERTPTEILFDAPGTTNAGGS